MLTEPLQTSSDPSSPPHSVLVPLGVTLLPRCLPCRLVLSSKQPGSVFQAALGVLFLTSWESGNEKGRGARHFEVAPQSPALGEASPSALSLPDGPLQHHGQRLLSTPPSSPSGLVFGVGWGWGERGGG